MAARTQTAWKRSLERFTVRASAGLVAMVLAGLGFALVWALVASAFPPLQALDRQVSDRLNALVAGDRLVIEVLNGITDFGGRFFLTRVLLLATVFLLIRRQPRLAAYVVVTSVGALILELVLKLIVGRLRPVVEMPVAEAPGMSFPSGHALDSMVGYGILVLVFLPAVTRRLRVPVIVIAVLLVLAVGFTRMALGVHYLSDVVGGWLLGVAWLGVSAAAFRLWRRERGAEDTPLTEGLEPEAEPALHGAPDGGAGVRHPWLAAAELAVGWVLVLGLLFGVGLLLTRVLPPDGAFLSFDRGVVRWLADHRNGALTAVGKAGASLGNTHLILAVTTAAGAIALAVLRRWRPVVFLTVLMAGEITLFMVSSTAVARSRPQVQNADIPVPPTASFPSGHTAATICLYAAIALLVWHSTRRWWRWAALAVAVVMPVFVALSRMYQGVHHPTDIMGSVLLAAPWLSLVWWVVRPLRRPESGTGRPESGTGRPESRAGGGVPPEDGDAERSGELSSVASGDSRQSSEDQARS